MQSPTLNSNEGQGWPEGLTEGTLLLYTHPKPTFLYFFEQQNLTI